MPLERIPEHEYHRRELGVVTNSGLKAFMRSPKSYREWVGEGRVDNDNLRFGRVFHAYTLEGRRPLVQPDFGNLRTKAAREERDIWLGENAGRDFVTADDWVHLHAMKKSALDHETAGKLLRAKGSVEGTLHWTDEATDLRCKCRIDKWIPGQRIAFDLKSAKTATEHGFRTAVGNFGYHIQAAHYTAGLRAHEMHPEWCFVVVEKAPPYDVGVYSLDDEFYEIANHERDKALMRMAHCIREDWWPGLNDDAIVALSPPGWMRRSM